MRANVIDKDGLIVNTIEVKDLSFNPGEGLTLVGAIADEGIGWNWNEGRPIRPAPASVVKTELELRIEALEAAKVDLDTRLKAVEEKPLARVK